METREATTQATQLEDLRAQLAQAEQQLNARPRDVAGASTTARRESAERRIKRLRASIARVTA